MLRHDRRRFLQALAVLAGTAGTPEASDAAGAVSSREAGEASSRTASGSGLIVVTTPRGNIGRQVLERLLQSGSRIRVVDRDPSRLPEHVRQRVEIVAGSHADSSVVNRAFKGADAVFWVCPPDPRSDSVEKAYLEFTRPACEAIRSHRVERVVSVSALGRGTELAKHAGYVTASLAMDDLLASTGAHFRALTMPSFMDNLLRQVEPIRAQGVFFSPISGDLKAPTCATRDIGAAATKLLLDRSWTGRGSVAVLGPEDLSFNDMARIMSDVLGKP
ncbi:MAG: NAD(P)H-binding protein, partial [Steroidobacteraceae bacterium]|nr:NAD(P)H-binding protein [Steroidobacteraceae bacterium]